VVIYPLRPACPRKVSPAVTASKGTVLATGKKNLLKTKKFTGKILACRFSAQVRLGLLCK